MRAEVAALIIGMAVAVLFTRLAPFALFGAFGLPAWAGRWLKHAPVAVFAGLVAPALLMPKGHLSLTPDNNYLLAGAAAVFLAWRYRNFVLTVGAGTTVMLVLRWLQL